MTGAQFGITVDSAAVRRVVNRLGVAALDLSAPMEDIGAALVSSTQQRFLDVRSPKGDRWQDVSPAYALRKVERGRDPKKILRAQNHLMNMINHLADRGGVAVGSNREYAAIHQLGGTDDMAPGPAAIPARPYLGISRDDEREIAATLVDHFGDAAA